MSTKTSTKSLHKFYKNSKVYKQFIKLYKTYKNSLYIYIIFKTLSYSNKVQSILKRRINPKISHSNLKNKNRIK